MESYSKIYIAVRDEAPDYMVPTLVAHSMLNAHCNFLEEYSWDDDTYSRWFHDSFRKVVIRVNSKEYDKIKSTMRVWEGHENTICNGEGSCLVIWPVESDKVPNVLKYAKLWKPKGENNV